MNDKLSSLRRISEELEAILGYACCGGRNRSSAAADPSRPDRVGIREAEAASDVWLGEEVVREAAELLEAMKCDSDCKRRFLNKDGTFKGGFDGCVKMFSNCCSGVKDPDRLCAYIGRKAGKIS